MNEFNDIILNSLQELVVEIQTNIDKSGKNATGNARNSIEIQSDGNSYRLLGVPYFVFLEEGRPGGNVPKGFYNIIKQWAVNKGLFSSDDRSLSRFAYFTARKIADFGTVQYGIGKRTDIYTDAIDSFTESLQDKLLDNITNII